MQLGFEGNAFADEKVQHIYSGGYVESADNTNIE